MKDNTLDLVSTYLKQQGMVDRSGGSILDTFSKLKGQPADEWLIPLLELNQDGMENQAVFYNEMAKMVGGHTIYDLFKSAKYQFVKWSLRRAIEESGITQGDRVLDIGCGTGLEAVLFGKIVGPSGRVDGIDISPTMVERANERLNGSSYGNVAFRVGSRLDLPYNHNFFDRVFVISSFSEGAIETSPDLGDFWPRKIAVQSAQQIRNVMKDTGKAIIIQPALSNNHDVIEALNTGYLECAGLKVVKTDYFDKVPLPDQYKPSGVLFVVEKAN